MIEVVTYETQDERELGDRKSSRYLTALEAKLSKRWGSRARLVRVRFIDHSRPANEHFRLPEVKRFVIESVWQSEGAA